MFKKIIFALTLLATIAALGFASVPARAAALPDQHNAVPSQDGGWNAPSPDDANTRIDNSEATTLALSDDIGEMADRIGEMADRIVVTEELIVETEYLLSDTAQAPLQ